MCQAVWEWVAGINQRRNIGKINKYLILWLFLISVESPPTILVRIPSGTAAVDEDTLIVFPGSILHLECLYSRKEGNPQWTWTSGFRQYLTGKFLTPIGIFFRRQFFPIAIVNRQSLSGDPSRHTKEILIWRPVKGRRQYPRARFWKQSHSLARFVW